MKLIKVAAAVTALALVLSMPASAAVLNAKKRLVSASGHRSGCVLVVHRVSKDYTSTVRYLQVKGWVNCRHKMNRGSVTGRAFGGGPRGDLVQDYLTGRAGREDYRLAIRCNNKTAGKWNHPRQQMRIRVHGEVARRGHTYEGLITKTLPITC